MYLIRIEPGLEGGLWPEDPDVAGYENFFGFLDLVVEILGQGAHVHALLLHIQADLLLQLASTSLEVGLARVCLTTRKYHIVYVSKDVHALVSPA